jgi:hypothetical protein
LAPHPQQHDRAELFLQFHAQQKESIQPAFLNSQLKIECLTIFDENHPAQCNAEQQQKRKQMDSIEKGRDATPRPLT